MATEQEPEGRSTDEELAHLRQVRFGRLPARVRPEDHVQLVETGQRPDRAAPAGGEDDWMLRNAAG
ncbi:hypothetical protein [Micromonospora sp. NBC_01796]|uniref:hypothetical protein n=1 Tax=Micromonospora sp. NBC_01796 TaxID=2975987 RepID=UPI002DDAF773|nr:hypothetical protein [Micromonospora sp. NBC_01796]WSA84944.1 hypothetical protein OIE47_32040 [Micromonospora sp. NBC_01796]